MPFIKGRYHMNPIMGEALEAAREAEATLAALRERDSADGADTGDDAGRDSTADTKPPVHRVEIEAAEMVPSHSGHAVRGFAARIHRLAAPSGLQSPAETHVFSNHRDLLDFLHDELEKEGGR